VCVCVCVCVCVASFPFTQLTAHSSLLLMKWMSQRHFSYCVSIRRGNWSWRLLWDRALGQFLPIYGHICIGKNIVNIIALYYHQCINFRSVSSRRNALSQIICLLQQIECSGKTRIFLLFFWIQEMDMKLSFYSFRVLIRLYSSYIDYSLVVKTIRQGRSLSRI
jgi:hypothetical protein